MSHDDKRLPTQAEIDNGPHAGLGTMPSDYSAGPTLIDVSQLTTSTSRREAIVRDFLQHVIGDNIERPGLAETPARVARAWREEWASGYNESPKNILKTFEDGAEGVDEMVFVRDLEFYSHCEHHLAPFFGVAHIAYIPDKRIVGLSKLARLLDIYAKRLQVQERICVEVVDAIMEHLKPQGAGVIIKAQHLCMCSRGVRKQRSTTITSALRGALRDDARARAEFLSLMHS